MLKNKRRLDQDNKYSASSLKNVSFGIIIECNVKKDRYLCVYRESLPSLRAAREKQLNVFASIFS